MIPESLETLLEQGVIHRVVRPLMSGKEAQVFLVEVEGEPRVAKIYKDAANRSFKHRAEYMEGRRMRNTRSQRAIARRSRYGREQEEEAWKNAEVDAIYRLRAAGVRVPEPFAYVDGVLVMELVSDDRGEPAPRLIDVRLEREEAEDLFKILLREVVKMLCAGLVHGDLSDFNVLLSSDGPVIIDFPQAVDAAANRNARKLLVRDVRNLQSFLARFVPDLKRKQYGDEMWELYEEGVLLPDTKLTGRAKKRGNADTESVLREIQAAVREERARRAALGLDPLPDDVGVVEDPLIAEMRARADRAKQQGDGGRKRKRKRGGRDDEGAGGRGDGERGRRDDREGNRRDGESRGRGEGRRDARGDEARPRDDERRDGRGGRGDERSRGGERRARGQGRDHERRDGERRTSGRGRQDRGGGRGERSAPAPSRPKSPVNDLDQFLDIED
ncbi:MAG: serine protein kinase RIO [Deltaproteobacteria bacterium]|nr:MAG: serine protein kinase RIO [Deltaproteobacteria bacterium]